MASEDHMGHVSSQLALVPSHRLSLESLLVLGLHRNGHWHHFSRLLAGFHVIN